MTASTDHLWLSVCTGGVSRVVAISGPRSTIGRDLRADIVVDDVKVSRLHAEIAQDDRGRFLLTDLASRNGTTVNGRQLVGTIALRGGEILQVGRTTLEVLAEAPAEPS